MSLMLIFLLTLRYMYIPFITVNLAIHGIITSTDLLTANLPAFSLFVWYSIVHTECYKKNTRISGTTFVNYTRFSYVTFQ